MSKIIRFILLELVVFGTLMAFSPITQAEEFDYKLDSSFNFGNSEVLIDGETGDINIYKACDIGNYGKCNDVCNAEGECIPRDNCMCDGFGNIVEQEYKPKGFWNKIKFFISNKIEKIKKVFSKKETKEKKVDNSVKKDSKVDHAFSSVVSYFEKVSNGGEPNKEEEQKAEENLEEAIDSVDSVADLVRLNDLIIFYCGQKYSNADYEKVNSCIDDLRKRLKINGDKIKERLVSEIDESDTGPDTFKKIEQLRALLMTAELPSGKKGTFFSIENIKWARKELARKILIWEENKLNTYMSLEDIQKFYRLVSAGSSIYTDGELKNNKGYDNHIFPGQLGLARIRYRARRMILQKMAKMDICNPNPTELKELQNLLNKYPGCEKLLGNAEACKRIMSGNLESAYKKLFDQDKGDEANDSDPNKATDPIDCNKKPVITPTFKDQPLDDVADVDYDSPEDVSVDDFVDTGENINNEGSTNDDDGDDIVCSGDECGDVIIDDGDENIEIDTDPEPDPNPEEPVNLCEIHIYPEEIIGYNFTLENCDKTFNDGIQCIANCGWIPPMIIFDQVENLCNETISGFVESEVIVPCEFRPEPDPGILQCVNDCLFENL